MKSFKNLTEEISNTYVFAFGRFNPPTLGHAQLIQTIERVAGDADYGVYVSQSQNANKDPLDPEVKLHFMKLMFPGVNLIPAKPPFNTFLMVAASLSGKYQNLVVVAGSDRVEAFQNKLMEYNGRDYSYQSIRVVSAGERDPDSDTVTGISATKMREAAWSGNFAGFRAGLGNLLNDEQAKDLFNAVRVGYNKSALEEFNPLREAYHAGELFRVGSGVIVEGQRYRVVERKPNSLIVEADGKQRSCWLDQAQPAESSLPVTDLIEAVADRSYSTWKPTTQLERRIKLYALDEEVEVSEDRWYRLNMRVPSGRNTWFFTSKAIGPVDYQNEAEFHQATGSYTDAKASAKVWARKHGHQKVYLYA